MHLRKSVKVSIYLFIFKTNACDFRYNFCNNLLNLYILIRIKQFKCNFKIIYFRFGMEEKTKRSVIWLHFSVISPGCAKCNLCGSKYSYKGGSTSNLKKHLESRHHTFLQKNVLPVAASTSTSTSTAITGNKFDN